MVGVQVSNNLISSKLWMFLIENGEPKGKNES